MARGRPKGSRNKPKPEAAQAKKKGAASATSGNVIPLRNDLESDENNALFFEHVRKYKDLLEIKKQTDANLKNHCKTARNDFGEYAIDQIKMVIDAESEEGEAKLKAEFESRQRVIRLLHLPWGKGELNLGPKDERGKAFQVGKMSGLKGEKCEVPASLHVTLHGDYISGWQDGQAALARALLRVKSPSDDIESGGEDRAAAEDEDADDWAADEPMDVRPEFLRRAQDERRDAESEEEHEAAISALDQQSEIIQNGLESLPATYSEE